MLSFEEIKRFHAAIPVPVGWLLAILYLFVGLLMFAAVLLLISGGSDEVARELPKYAEKIGRKLLFLYSIFLLLYAVFRIIAWRNER